MFKTCLSAFPALPMSPIVSEGDRQVNGCKWERLGYSNNVLKWEHWRCKIYPMPCLAINPTIPTQFPRSQTHSSTATIPPTEWFWWETLNGFGVSFTACTAWALSKWVVGVQYYRWGNREKRWVLWSIRDLKILHQNRKPGTYNKRRFPNLESLTCRV